MLHLSLQPAEKVPHVPHWPWALEWWRTKSGMLQEAAGPWERCSGQTRAPAFRPASVFPGRPSSLPPPVLSLCQARDEGHIPGKVCPLNHTAVLIHIVISSVVHSQREEIGYKISPKICTEAQSKPQRKIVFAGKDGANVAHVYPPVTEAAVDAPEGFPRLLLFQNSI